MAIVDLNARAVFWRERHREQQARCVRRLRIALALGWALAGMAIFGIVSFLAGDIMAAAGVVGSKDKIEAIDKILANAGQSLGLPTYVTNSAGAFLFAALVFAVSAFLANADRAKRWAADLFPSYNPVGFDPIPYPVSEIGADRVLPWASDSAMDRIFRTLKDRLSDPAATGGDKAPFWRPFSRPPVPVPFDHVLLLGRPGAGKSRLAEHLVRQMGRRDVLGDRRKGEPASPQAATALARDETRRRFAWWRARERGDPWDSGRLAGAPPAAFAEWRPARPTMLWMDDPLASDARAWINALREHAPQWRYPVRLVIANQARLHEVPDPAPENVFILRGDTYFTPHQILALARADNISPFDADRAAQVHALTEGNPLLVELAFEALRRGKSPADLTQEGLIDARVQKVLDTLRQADANLVRNEALTALALGTLAGPRCPLAAATAHVPGHGLQADLLQKGFPAEAARGERLNAVLPMIKPEIIGDAFVRRLEREDETIPARLRDALLALDREKWLRTVGRLGRGEDATADAFCAPPAGFDQADEALCERAIRAWITLGHFGWRDPYATALHLNGVLLGLPTIAAKQAMGMRLLEWHMAEVEADWQARCRSGEQWRAALAAGKTTAEAAAEQERAATRPLAHRFMAGDAIPLIGLLLGAFRFADSGEGRFTPADARERMALGERLNEVSRVAYAGSVAPMIEDCFSGMARMVAHDETAILAELMMVRNWRYSTASNTLAKTAFVGSMERSLAHFTVDADRAKVWAAWGRLFRFETLLSDKEELPKVIESLVSEPPWRDDRDMQHLRAQAWRWLAAAEGQDPANCMAAQQQVEAITSQPRYREDRDMQLERAQAWRHLAFAEREDPANCRAAQQQVEVIACQPRYREDRDMQFERAAAWRYLAYADSEDPARCQAAQQQVEVIADQPRYREDRDMQRERAAAWRQLVFAEREDPARCQAAQQQVEAITSQPRYREDRAMQFERATAWRYLAYAEREDPARCLAAQQQVEAITSQPRYRDDRDMQRERTMAWRPLAYAERENPANCRAAQQQVETIAGQLHYLQDRGMQFERALAGGALAYAERNAPLAYRAAIVQLERICSAWPGDKQFADELDEARSYRPGG